MDISTENRNGALIARAVGRIDGANARDFEAAVQSAISASEGPVIIDCEDLSYISSAGLRAILLIAKTLGCLLYTSPSPRDRTRARMPSSA